ncbi:hypothetical protein QWY84_08580 [Aquisalimonas lutea]|uniref:hypothetical protein n=1 Tax=Aquisalimonas lutea TaxID=1327750 RepID=UPI0025B4826D|nr:hypothetical protein [Aquisalimonas lutea]MDN3517662.1 hypothetical protein [Aquisalimonas lutea]
MTTTARENEMSHNNAAEKPFGIRLTLPEGDPRRAEHLLGPDWEAYRWYATREERDRAMADMRGQHPYYQRGERPSVLCEPVDR